MDELKPCPNCGSDNLHGFDISHKIECNDCSEIRDEEEWQADTAREKILTAENAKLRKMVDYLIERMIEDHVECPDDGDTCPHIEGERILVEQCVACWKVFLEQAVNKSEGK